MFPCEKFFYLKYNGAEAMLLVGRDERLPPRYNRIITANYTVGFGVKVVDSNDKWWGRRLQTGTRWKTFGTKTISRRVYYDLAVTLSSPNSTLCSVSAIQKNTSTVQNRQKSLRSRRN